MDPEGDLVESGGGQEDGWDISLEVRVCPYLEYGSLYRERKGYLDHPIKIGRLRKYRLGSPIKKTEMFYRCLGMIRTHR